MVQHVPAGQGPPPCVGAGTAGTEERPALHLPPAPQDHWEPPAGPEQRCLHYCHGGCGSSRVVMDGCIFLTSRMRHNFSDAELHRDGGAKLLYS